ncbi:MAG: MotE family protein [Candidatus Brocadiia bacterium]
MPDEKTDEQHPDREAAEAEQATEGQQGAGLLSPWLVKRALAVFLGTLCLSALIALIAGGHFAREPLCRIRHVPLLGALVPEPEAPHDQEPEEVPNVAAVHPMPAAQISDLITDLRQARQRYERRRQELQRQEERLKALQRDLQRDRDRLDQLMGSLAERQQQLVAQRKALEAEALVAESQERRRLVKLARIYEDQEPTSAAAELQALHKNGSPGLAAKVLAEMQEKKAAMVFDAMDPETALALKADISHIRYRDDAESKEQKP